MNRRNYQKELDQLLQNLRQEDKSPTLLLHEAAKWETYLPGADSVRADLILFDNFVCS